VGWALVMLMPGKTAFIKLEGKYVCPEERDLGDAERLTALWLKKYDLTGTNRANLRFANGHTYSQKRTQRKP
jgi:hypothetical protein